MIYVSHCRTCGFVFRVAAARPAFSQRCPLCLSACDPIAVEQPGGRFGKPRSDGDRPLERPLRRRSAGP